MITQGPRCNHIVVTLRISGLAESAQQSANRPVPFEAGGVGGVEQGRRFGEEGDQSPLPQHQFLAAGFGLMDEGCFG